MMIEQKPSNVKRVIFPDSQRCLKSAKSNRLPVPLETRYIFSFRWFVILKIIYPYYGKDRTARTNSQLVLLWLLLPKQLPCLPCSPHSCSLELMVPASLRTNFFAQLGQRARCPPPLAGQVIKVTGSQPRANALQLCRKSPPLTPRSCSMHRHGSQPPCDL